MTAAGDGSVYGGVAVREGPWRLRRLEALPLRRPTIFQ
jgi:hypothetical protein